MRERTTWSRAEIAKTAFGRTAEDPRSMNQDHIQQQPAADAYGIGGPSEFGEDVHPSTNTWKAEQSGGETKRNEIGMPDMRKDTFNHPEKTAADDKALCHKADLAAKVARAMFRGRKATEAMIEDQALALMHVPDAALVETANRLANDDEDEKEQAQQSQDKQANDDEKEQQAQGQQAQDKQAKDANDEEKDQQAKGQQDQGKEAGQIPEAFKENIQKMKDKAKDKDDDKSEDKGQNKEAGALFAQALQAGDANGVQNALQAMIAGALQQMSQQQQPQQQQAQQVQQQMAQDPQQQQQMAQGQQPQQQQAQQQQMQMAEDQLLDQMLQQDLGQPQQQLMTATADHEIQMEANTMDVGEVSLGEADDVLNTLFASNTEYQDAAEATALSGQPVTAGQGVTRTASTRTVGTRPANGVAQIGGASASNNRANDVDRLSSLWATAPDVKSVFR